jgi:6-phosphogluconolactonase
VAQSAAGKIISPVQNVELIPFASDDNLAQAAASSFARIALSARLDGSTPTVALSGGRIAVKFFSAVVAGARATNLSFAPLHFFWADERCVPPNDAESNFRVARELLLIPLKIPDNQIHRIRGEESPAFAVAEAEAEIWRIAALTNDSQPMLDLIFLGMGEDGHVASLFPDEAESVIASPAIYRAVAAVKPPPQRITLGYAAIAAARQVWVLASGAGKEAALRESLDASGQTPLARVIKSRAQTRIFTDIPSR